MKGGKRVNRGDPVLVRNSRRDVWVLRAFDTIDSSWVGESRCRTTDGETWKRWTEYAGNKGLDGTSISADWRPMDVCIYSLPDGARRIGFFIKIAVDENGRETALVSRMPFNQFDMSGLQTDAVDAGLIVHPEEEFPYWKGSLYSEEPDPNPFGSRIVPC